MKPSDLNKKHQQIMKFAEWTMDKIGIKNRPKIELTDDIAIVKKHRAYGATTPDGHIWTYVGDRTPADAMRTLCHEILHAKQFEDGVANDHMDKKQEQHIEDLANAHAGRMMRKYGKKDASIYESELTEYNRIINPDSLGSLYYKKNFHNYKPGENGQLVKHVIRSKDADSEIAKIAERHGVDPSELHFVPITLSKAKELIAQHKQTLGINEGREGSLIHDVADSLPYAYSIPELDSSNNPYLQYKFSVAIAGARGKKSRDSDGLQPFHDKSEAEYFNDEEVVISFDPHIGEIIDQAMADIGMKGGKRIIGVKGSKEPKDTSTKSPVQGFKGFK